MPSLYNIDPLQLRSHGMNGSLKMIDTLATNRWVRSDTKNSCIQVFTNERYNVTIAVLHSRLEHAQQYKLWMTGDCWELPEEYIGNIRQSDDDLEYFYLELNHTIRKFLKSVVVSNHD